MRLYQIDSGDPDESAERKRRERDDKEPSVTEQRNAKTPKRIDWQPGLKDFYNGPDYDELAVEQSARKEYQKFLDDLDEKDRILLKRSTNFYVARFKNVGGLVMPIIVRVHYADNSSELVRIPAEIWRQDSRQVDKLFLTDKEIVRMELDPYRETADTEISNNSWPPKLVPSRFQLFKKEKKKNPMQKLNEGKEGEETEDEKTGEKNEKEKP